MLQLKTDYTIVIVTHNLGQAARVSKYTGFMLTSWELGVEFGETERMFTNPVTKMRFRLHHRTLRVDGVRAEPWGTSQAAASIEGRITFRLGLEEVNLM